MLYEVITEESRVFERKLTGSDQSWRRWRTRRRFENVQPLHASAERQQNAGGIPRVAGIGVGRGGFQRRIRREVAAYEQSDGEKHHEACRDPA